MHIKAGKLNVANRRNISNSLTFHEFQSIHSPLEDAEGTGQRRPVHDM